MAEDKRPRVSGRRIRVMHVLPNGDLGGGQQTVCLLARHFDQRRFEISVVCPTSPTMEHLAGIPGIKLFSLPFPKVPGPRVVRRLASLIRVERPDIVHTHLFHGDLYGFLVTRLAPVNLLLSTIQGVNFRWEEEAFPRRARWWLSARVYRAIYHAFDGIASCSAAVREAICSRPGVKVRPDQVQVIYNSVDVGELAKAAVQPLRRPLPPLPSGTFSPVKRLVTVANFAPFKGHRVLLHALRRLRENIPIQCLLVGAGPEGPLLETLVSTWGLNEQVAFLGAREDVPAILRECDLFVLPSLWEPFGIALVEAMALGVPVVASTAGGIPEIVSDGVNGVLVPAGDPGKLAAAILGILSDPVSAARIVAEARKTAESRFEARAMVAAYERWYETMLLMRGRAVVS